MRGQHKEEASERAGYEFFPPIEFPDTWGIAWDTHLNAAAAWQAADGNAQRQCEAPTAPVTGVCVRQEGDDRADASGKKSGLATVHGLSEMDALLESLRGQLQQIHVRVQGLASSEAALRQTSLAGEAGEPADEAGGRLHPENERILGQMAHLWLDALATAQQGARALLEGGRAGGASSFAPMIVQAGGTECRPGAMVFDFPERRTPN